MKLEIRLKVEKLEFSRLIITDEMPHGELRRRLNIILAIFLSIIFGSVVFQANFIGPPNIHSSTEAGLRWPPEIVAIVLACLAAGGGFAIVLNVVLARFEDRVAADREAVEKRIEEKSRVIEASVEKRQISENAIIESERRFRAIVEGASHGVIVHNDGVPLFANPAIADMLGYDTAEEVLELRSIADFVFEDDAMLVRNLWTRRMDGEALPDVVGYRCQKKDGTVISVEVRATTIDWDGMPAVLATVYDTTQQKSGEYAVRENAARLRRLVETIPYGVQENDVEGTITFSNPAHAAMLGYEHGDLVGRKIWDFELDEDRREQLKIYFAFLTAEQPTPEPYFGESLTKDGRRIDVRVDWTYILSQTGHLLGFTSVITDVTAAKVARESLEKSEQHFRTLAQASIQGITVIQGNRFVFANPAAARMLGYNEPDEFMAIESVDEIVHPDNAELVRRRREARLKGEAAPNDYEMRLISKEGRAVWIYNRVTVIEWDNAPAVFSIYDDITAQKLAERSLELAE